MSWLDDALVGVAILLLVVRQFCWRTADPASILKLPVIVLVAGFGWLVWEIATGEPLTLLTAGAFAAELVLVSATGTVMGIATRMRDAGGALRYKLTAWGILLWAVFLGARIGSFVVAYRLGAHLLETTPAIMISFGANRLASSLVVRRRLLVPAGQPVR